MIFVTLIRLIIFGRLKITTHNFCSLMLTMFFYNCFLNYYSDSNIKSRKTGF